MSKTLSFGTIYAILPGKTPRYQVRLDHGEEMVFDHALIQPPRTKPLKKGCRLAIHQRDGKVDWASTDLSRHRTGPADKSKARPAAPPGGTRGGGERQKTTTVLAMVVNVEPALDQVTFQAPGGQKVRVRLPREHPAWSSLFMGHKVVLEKTFDEAGNPHYTVLLPSGASEEKPATWRDAPQKTSARAEQARAKTAPPSGSPPIPRPAAREEREKAYGQPEKIEVDRIGIDPAYFRQRQKEGHRYEIMAFLSEHLNDELIEWYRMRPEQPARRAVPTAPLAPAVERALHAVDGNFKGFYTHQARALDAIRAGKHLILVTQTASGKTLCYNPAIFEHFLAADPSAHALYLFPLNALLMDQKEKIDQLASALAGHGAPVRAEVLKGGVPTDTRRGLAKEPPHILALNPELLSVILGEADLWAGFFTGLRYVVIDEVHTYRGILGMHTAGLIRRLLLAARRQGNIHPQFILSSATVCNPLDLATRLTSLPADSFYELGERDDGSFQANKHWAVLNPDWHDNNHGGHNNYGYDNYLNTAAMTMVELLASRGADGRPAPLNTILFAKSIREVKKAYKIVRENLKANHPELAEKVRHYVSSDLSADEKREIYSGLKSGQLLGVISTNALEAGIDIGKLDACIIAGFPFWVMRMRQMAGRVGRHQEGLVLYVPHPVKPVDQYYRSYPELLLDQPPEAFVVDAENPYIARKHINAAAYKLKGISQEELDIFGSKAAETVSQAIQDGVMQRSGKKVYGTWRNYKDPSDPYLINGIRSNTQRPYTVCRSGGGECPFSAACLDTNKKGCERQIAVLDQLYAYRDCYPGAIYEAMDGEYYKVVSFDDQRRVIRMTQLSEKTLERTFVEESTDIQILGAPRLSKSLPGGAALHLGEVRVTRSFTGFYTYTLKPVRRCRRCRRDFEQSVPVCPVCRRKTAKYFEQSKRSRQNFPTPYQERGFEIAMKTLACWMTIPAEMEKALGCASPCKLPGEGNRVLQFLHSPAELERVAQKFAMKPADKQALEAYVQTAGQALQAEEKTHNNREVLLFPGVYAQCLLHVLRGRFLESRALEIFAHLTHYPVTENLKHICRKCQTTALFPAMHTLEHTVTMRYPSVALGDPTDLASHTTLGHPSTGQPTIFWYDHYEGGLGAADKVYEQIEQLLQNSERTLLGCSCTTLEGCPHCTQIGHCDLNNDSLTKPGALALIAGLLGKHFELPLTPFIYPKNRKARFEKTYKENEYARQEHGMGEENPAGTKQENRFDPYGILRVQKRVHDQVLGKAYEVRSAEITNELPAISAVELTRAYQAVSASARPETWEIQASQTPYQILEILPEATLRMVQQIFRVIALHVHPDLYPGDKSKANEMMKLANMAYNRIVDEKKHRSEEDTP